MKIWVLRPTVRCGSKVLGSAARPIFTSPAGALSAAAGTPATSAIATAISPRARGRIIPMLSSLSTTSGAGPAALDLDDDVAERLRPDVPQGVPQRPLVPAHDRARGHLDPVDRPVGVRALDDVALDDDGGVVEVVGVPAGLLTRR